MKLFISQGGKANKAFRWLTVLLYAIVTFTGCATVEHMTLPASKEDKYVFPAYIVHSPEGIEWRFISKNYEMQSLFLFHKDYMSNLFFWITPVLMDTTDKDREEKIIDYFQKKTLEEFRLSPDVHLTEQSIKRTDVAIGQIIFKTVTVAYEMEKRNFMFTIYYYVSQDNQILYSIAVLKPLFIKHKPGWEDELRNSVERIIANIEFVTPEIEVMQELRVIYAHSDFVESINDKYLKEKIPGIQEKFTVAVREAEQWLEVKPDSYKAYDYLGLLASYNHKFEQFGDSFDAQKVEKHLKKAIEIKPYYKSAHVNLAKLYEITGRTDEAVEAYTFAIRLSPNDEDLYYKLGQMYETNGDRDKAREFYNKAIRYWSSGFATRDELKNKLKNWDR